jgi:hypothetical protein
MKSWALEIRVLCCSIDREGEGGGRGNKLIIYIFLIFCRKQSGSKEIKEVTPT